MLRLPDVRQRQREPELMDGPALPEHQHHQALRGLRQINRLSGSARIVWKPLCTLLQHVGGRSLRVLDLATGGGDVPIDLWRLARRHGLSLEIDGCDRSALAIDHARHDAKRAGADINFFVLDALRDALPNRYDIIVTSLFLHHLAGDEAVRLLRKMAQAAGRMMLIHDLVRSRRGWALAYLGTRLLCASAVVHADGPQSVRAAYRLDEVRAMARQAGLHDTLVEPRWPCRFLLTWRRP